jgi:dihydropyrimidinase
MSAYDLRLANADAVLPGQGRAAVDIGIRDGRIVALLERGVESLPATETVDLAGRVIVPGGVDAHVHLGQDLSVPKTEADAAAETASAAAGGMTTVLAYLMSPRPYEQLHDDARTLMGTYSHTDFGFHYCLVTPEQVRDIPRYLGLGVSSFKFFMNFRGDEGAYLGLPGNDDGFLFDLLKATADNGAMANPHAENIELVWRLRREQEQLPDAGLEAWNRGRPAYVEAEAEQRVAYLAGIVGASLYAVHVTSAEALDVLRRQRERHRDIFIETCPHYLTLDTGSSMGSRAKVNPPLRSAVDRLALWAGLGDGSVDVVGSDHVPRHFSAKDKDIWSASAGFPGVGTLLPLMIDEGQKQGLSLERIVDLTATRPAQLFGLYPRKGVIAVGADADLAVLRLDQTSTVRAATQHSGAGYSVWEGLEVGCVVEHTLLRGAFAVRDGVVQKARGEYVERARSGRAALDQLR